MNIQLDAADAALLVDMLLSQRRSQQAMASMAMATEAERALATLKADTATRVIARVREALEVKP